MDVADLRLVDAVAERGSFTAAAVQLRMSQPSVSARVARALGAVLFIRDPRGARLTEAGTAYLGYVRRCLRLLEDGARAAAAQSPAPPWRIGLPASYAPALTPHLLRLAAAGVRPVTVSTGHSRDLRAAVLDGHLDLAVAHPGPLPAGLGRRHLLDTPLVAVARSGTDPGDPATGYAVHRWASDADAVIADLLADGVDRHRIALVSPASTALALATHHGYVAVVPELAAADAPRRDRGLGPVTPAASEHSTGLGSPGHPRLGPGAVPRAAGQHRTGRALGGVIAPTPDGVAGAARRRTRRGGVRCG